MSCIASAGFRIVDLVLNAIYTFGRDKKIYIIHIS